MKNCIFAYILFALLLAVNTASFQLNKRDITFGPCDTGYPIDLLNVKITDPPEPDYESFDVSGNLTKNDIIKNQTLLIIAGTPFNISASDVPTSELPYSYFLIVCVAYSDYKLFACAVATVGENSEKSKTFDIYKII
ncbi:hypothetical protein C2G38_2163890 [Gigaspora rosea]|uniref:MD-2-related lipid-recognition domain-containing protein n=1 Tax=Gigaspora rosea TaxID=44941 RepID=A0A397VUH0_9GLOM|nr:hypothetical protein C2G38_2163890 [Gigaspora rosea]